MSTPAGWGPETVSAAAERWEPSIHALTWRDPETPPPAIGPLAGLPVGVKDIIDTAQIPTEYGSAIFAGHVPGTDAAVVARLRAAGAWIAAKTVTAELAYFAPGPTRNPWSPDRTPGGSSMGSAAAVAAGILPAALGTQTNGSIIRPAAFCGVVGVKPSFGRIPRDGVLSFSPNLDHVGVIAASVALARAVLAPLIDGGLGPAPTARPLRLGVWRTPDWAAASPAMRAAFDSATARIADAGIELTDWVAPDALADPVACLEWLATIMAVDGDRHVGGRLGAARSAVSPQLRDLLDRGAATEFADYTAAHERRAELRAAAPDWFSGHDAILTLSTLGEAPSAATTGDPRCATRWTLLGLPAVTLPCGLGEGGLPLGLQLVGAPGADEALLDTAARIEALLGFDARPALP